MRRTLLAASVATVLAGAAACKRDPAVGGTSTLRDSSAQPAPGAAGASAPDEVAALLAQYARRAPTPGEVQPPPTIAARLVDHEALFDDAVVSRFDPRQAEAVFALTGGAEGTMLKTSPVRDQGDRDTCTAFAAVAALETLALQRGRDADADLSEEELFARIPTPKNGRGATEALVSGLAFTERDWPYGAARAAEGSRGVLRATAARSIKADEVAQAVAGGQPVYLAVRTNASWFAPDRGAIDPSQAATAGRHAGHTVAIVGVKPGYLVFKNSWGTGWGAQGFGYLGFDYCSRWYCAFWAIEDITTEAPAARRP